MSLTDARDSVHCHNECLNEYYLEEDQSIEGVSVGLFIMSVSGFICGGTENSGKAFSISKDVVVDSSEKRHVGPRLHDNIFKGGRKNFVASLAFVYKTMLLGAVENSDF